MPTPRFISSFSSTAEISARRERLVKMMTAYGEWYEAPTRLFEYPLSIAPPCAKSHPRSKHQRISRAIYLLSTVAHSRQMQSSSSTSTAPVSAIFGRLFAEESAGLAEVGAAAASAAASAAHAINSNITESYVSLARKRRALARRYLINFSRVLSEN